MVGDSQSSPRFHQSLVLVASAALALSAVAGLRAQSPRANQTPPKSAAEALPAQSTTVATDLEGELEVLYEDSAHGARLLHFLKTSTDRLQLQFAGAPPTNLQTGMHVRVHGTLQNHTLALGSGSNVQALSLPTSSTFGAQQVLVILVNFSDNTSIPYDPSVAYSTTFTTVNNFYLENSYGQTSLTGQVAGWYTIPMSSATCDTATIASQAEAAATAAGVNVSAYSKRVYAFPQIAPCGWWGLASVGGNPSQGWINGVYALQVVAHELGHSFGLYHSHSMPCTPTCSSVEYGDDHDVMADVPSADFNAFQKERLGWLNYGSSPTIETVSASGTYSIDQYELPGSGPKALKILQSTDSSGNHTWYYVENRTSNGFDNGMATGVIIHQGYDADPNSSNEWDLTPGASGATWILAPGQTFTDPVLGMSITTEAASVSGATVNITLPSVPCATGTPSLSVSPAASILAAPGATLNYAVTLANTDGSTCSSTYFNLGEVTPSGWAASFNPASLSLAPGTSGSATLTVGVPTGTAGSYALTTSATRSNTSGPSPSVSNSVTVSGSLAMTLSTRAVKGGYQLSATVKAGAAALSGAAVTFTVTASGGKVTTLTATTSGNGVANVKFGVSRNTPAGTYQVVASTAASGLSGSATASIVVQ